MRIFVVALVVALVAVTWATWTRLKDVLAYFGSTWTYSDLGVWGDSFGALNALFAALGFSAVCYTLLLQQQQIKSSRRDQHKQQFDATFFRLLEFLKEAKFHSIYIKYDSRPFGTTSSVGERGQGAFKVAFEDLCLRIIGGEKDADGLPSSSAVAKLYGSDFYEKHGDGFHSYFVVLDTLLKKIDSDKMLSTEDKNSYVRLLLTQIGSYEISLYAIHALWDIETDSHAYIKDYDMFLHIPQSHDHRQFMHDIYRIKTPQQMRREHTLGTH